MLLLVRCDRHGRYFNRQPRKPLFVSALLYLNPEWYATHSKSQPLPLPFNLLGTQVRVERQPLNNFSTLTPDS